MTTTFKGTTNTTPNSKIAPTITCPVFWAKAQEFAYKRLSDFTHRANDQTPHREVLDTYAARARRIAATYAKFYLETEEHGDPQVKGRYYWMALGAFAVKTVVCLMEDIRIEADKGAKDALGKGNLWLFMDIAPWHWMHSLKASEFWHCIDERDMSQCTVTVVNDSMNVLPWAKEVMPKVKHFKKTPELVEGFTLLKAIEAAIKSGDTRQRGIKQLEHLMAIANHEQANILQKLSWEDPALQSASALTRQWFIKPFAPKAQIVFAQACETDEQRLKSIAPESMIVENLESRMKWIRTAAKKFHGLMQGTAFKGSDVYMEGQIAAIATWVNAKDPANQPRTHMFNDANPAPPKMR